MPASEILPGLFLSGQGDTPGFRGVVICVLEHSAEAPLAPEKSIHIPVMDYGGQPGKASMANLERISIILRHLLNTGHRVLVHCGAGIERSPLAVAWHLHASEGMSLDEAYRLLKQKRPEVEDRRAWLP